MKSRIHQFLIAAVLCLALSGQAFADTFTYPDSQQTYLTAPASTSSTTYATLLTLTTASVGSDTNHYMVTACIQYTETSGGQNAGYFELTSDGTLITGAEVAVSGPGFIVIQFPIHSVAASKAVALKYKSVSTVNSLKVSYATLSIVGHAAGS